MADIIDLRSDTLTRPGPTMRQAMAEADVGDDVYGEDPTVNALERRVAQMLGKESALFVPSGTMGNLVAIASQIQPGEEIIVEREAHVLFYEAASVASLFGAQTNPLDGDRGVITAARIAPHIRAGSMHSPATTMIAIENTHNRAGGSVFPLDEMKRIRQLADERGLKVHLDGARLWNAHVASGVALAEYAACADSVSTCFSKGLGAPVGSIVVSSAEVVDRARRLRKRLGGGMRQAGVLAAAAMYALDHHIERMAEDHEHARRIGEAVSEAEGLSLAYPVETNMLIIEADPDVHPVRALLAALRDRGVLANAVAPTRIRLVTHLDISARDVERVVDIVASLRPQ